MRAAEKLEPLADRVDVAAGVLHKVEATRRETPAKHLVGDEALVGQRALVKTEGNVLRELLEKLFGIGDPDVVAFVLGGKTGFTEKNTSGYCIVSYAKGDNGHFYVTVTAKAEGWMANVDDILYIFNNHVK
jgi:hypothetical protein